MMLQSRKLKALNSRFYNFWIALLVFLLSISEFLLSEVFVRVSDSETNKNDFRTLYGNNAVNKSKRRVRKKRRSKKITVLSRNQSIVTDLLCPYCRYDYVKQNSLLTCGRKLVNDWHLGVNSTSAVDDSFLKAAITLSRDKSMKGACSRCDPSSCTSQDKQYYRMDEIAPQIKGATTHYLRSIPAIHRIPKEALQNLTDYFSSKKNVHPARKYFFEFNPSIVRLPESQKTIPNATYLASFRVSTCHDCVPSADDYIQMMNGPRSTVSHTEYIGLAILDDDLNILQEVVANMKKIMFRFQDPRLFVLHDQLYVGSYHNLRPLWLTRPTLEPKYIGKLDHVWADAGIDKNLLIRGISVGKKGHCSKDSKTQSIGKNLNYFIDSRNDTILEVQAMGPYELMNFSDVCDVKVKTAAVFIQDTASIPYPSFGTTDELDLAKQNYNEGVYTSERGSACCVSIQHPDGRSLRLGISHSKTLYGRGNRKLTSNQFYSSFYAFEAEAPYKVVARSGRFCFGFSSDSEIENPYTRMQMSTMKMIKVKYPNCPRIHFVSGMVEKVNDPSKLIVAYGVNDCVPRMVTIAKSDVLRLLFSPHENA